MIDRTVPAHDKIFTLFGDYLLNRREGVWVRNLIILLGQLGLPAPSVRTVLSRMTHQGWLTVEHVGLHSRYGLTRRSRLLLEAERERIDHRPRRDEWDGSWYLVSCSLPDADRYRRSQFRLKMLSLGCGSLTSELWISPYDVTADVRQIADALRVSHHTDVFRAEHLAFSSADQLVAQCWDLATLNGRYSAFVSRWNPAVARCRTCRLVGGGSGDAEIRPLCTSVEDCFVRRFQLVHEYRAFAMEDPRLPASLLPKDWQGEAATQLFETYHAMLRAPAERHVEEMCDADRIARS